MAKPSSLPPSNRFRYGTLSSVPRWQWHFYSHFFRPIHSFGRIGQTCLMARLRSAPVAVAADADADVFPSPLPPD